MLTHRHIAKRKAARWQAGAVVLIVGAGAAAGLPLHERLTPAEQKFPEPPPIPPMPDRAGELAKLNFQQTASTLKLLGPTVVATVAPVDAPVDQPVAPVAAPVQASNEWVYVGHLSTPKRRTAMIRVDGEQMLFGVGTKHNQTTVKTIEPTYVEVETGGATRRLELAQRTLEFPVDGPKRPVPVRGPQPGGQAPMAMTQPAAPQQFDQARLAALEAARRAQMAEKGLLPTDRPPIDPGSAFKRLTAVEGDVSQRMAALHEFGITPGMSYDDAVVRLKTLVGERAEEVLKHNEEAIQENANSKGEGGE